MKGHPLHKMFVYKDSKQDEAMNDLVFGSVRSRVLQKLLVLWFVFCVNRGAEDNPQPVYREVVSRYKEKHKDDEIKFPVTRVEVLYELKPDDIRKVIGSCSDRTAAEYIDALRKMFVFEG
jgi:hypothetical protein